MNEAKEIMINSTASNDIKIALYETKLIKLHNSMSRESMVKFHGGLFIVIIDNISILVDDPSNIVLIMCLINHCYEKDLIMPSEVIQTFCNTLAIMCLYNKSFSDFIDKILKDSLS